ncbi:hypothetical protein [Ramlibacter pallidus]|uniref:Uncharacterized protein n=1 Tax=Ramlibacter pallidus TaxID=2780087 RepID=A0ABR9S692_9BURK|nr:hypothetical protein [Ramlibacter pallidus]MBE7369040.1 hypothetical protein [Ramlibacter pallidus]
MRNSNKQDARARADDKDRSTRAGESSSLLQRLMQKIAGAGEPERGDGRARPLEPAGRRSGKGAESVAPYLDEKRNTQPGPLE